MNRMAMFVVVLIGSGALGAVMLGGVTSAETVGSVQAWLGTWTLNLEESSYSPFWAVPHSEVMVVDRWNDGVRQTTTVESAQGKPAHLQWIGKYDGQDYPLTGAVAGEGARISVDTTAYRLIDERTLERIRKKGGEVIDTTLILLSHDGRTRTLTVSGKDSRGRLVTNVFVYDKQ